MTHSGGCVTKMEGWILDQAQLSSQQQFLKAEKCNHMLHAKIFLRAELGDDKQSWIFVKQF